MLPSISATATSFAPSCIKNLDSQYPTLPKPWTINFLFFNPGSIYNFLAILAFPSNCFAE
jgi:hypothetical protein